MRPALIILFVMVVAHVSSAQSLTPAVINAAGGNARIPLTEDVFIVYYNISEPVIDDVTDSNGKFRLTQGFLQPDVIGSGILTVNSLTTAMSCLRSNDASVSLNANGLYLPFRYTWYKNGVLLPDTGSTLLNMGVGNYSFVVTDKKENKRTGTCYIENGSNSCQLIIHNGLSPNSDGHNDFFHIEHIEDYPQNKVSVFNRWGDMIWSGTHYDNLTTQWKGQDGTGNNVSSGTYYYIIEFDGKKMTGWVELMR